MTRPIRFLYEPGAVRWRYVSAGETVKKPKVENGWRVTHHDLDYHPLTFAPIAQTQSWAKETFVGEA